MTWAGIAAGLADIGHARFGAVAEIAIVAVAVDETVDADIVGLIASLTGAGIAAGLADVAHAGFGAVAEGSVIAHRVVGGMRNRPSLFVARIDSAIDTIIQTQGARVARASGVAGLRAVAEHSVVAVCVFGARAIVIPAPTGSQ